MTASLWGRIVSRILLVEDDAALSRGVAALLKAGGHAVDCTGDGESALNYIADEPYGLIVLDIGLPGISGFEVLRTLRARSCSTNARAAALTSDHVVSKPSSPP